MSFDDAVSLPDFVSNQRFWYEDIAKGGPRSQRPSHGWPDVSALVTGNLLGE